jgi:hypothetical protein
MPASGYLSDYVGQKSHFTGLGTRFKWELIAGFALQKP